ncbi:Zinc finger protein 808 [Eumeta japonica]|uniref:Zinc finger protein 808 n=1 Tax=Eumeta variegata TaxID=151549 RepID=A0A4C1VK76_EUMVA|nr:Zinc finger protein 808 [Eumeta japonica]
MCENDETEKIRITEEGEVINVSTITSENENGHEFHHTYEFLTKIKPVGIFESTKRKSIHHNDSVNEREYTANCSNVGSLSAKELKAEVMNIPYLVDDHDIFKEKTLSFKSSFSTITDIVEKLKEAYRAYRKEYCLESFLNLASIETCELPIPTNKSSIDNKYKIFVLYRSEAISVLAPDTIKVEDINIKTSLDRQVVDNNIVSKVDTEISSNEIKNVALIQDENIESDALSNIIIDSTPVPRFCAKDDLVSDKVETNKFIDIEEASSRNNIKPEYHNCINSASCDNSGGEYDYTMPSEYNTRIQCRTRRKRKQRFVTEDGIESYKTKRTRQRRNMKSIENKCADERISTISSNKNKTLKLKKSGSVKKTVKSADEIFLEAKEHVIFHKDEKIKPEHGETEIVDDRYNNEQSFDDGSQREKIGKVFKVTRTSGPPFDASYFEGYATFVLLTPEEAQKEVLSRKETPNYMYSEFKCDLCFRGFESKVTYHNHMKKHSPVRHSEKSVTAADLSCPEYLLRHPPSRKLFLAVEYFYVDLNKTIKVTYSEHGEYKCEFCHLRFRNQRYLNKHKLGAHKRKFSCKICPFVCFCSMPNSLLMHKRKKHLTTAVCDLCGSTFNTERGVRSHKLLAHREETNPRLGPVCDLCDVHFANEAAWKKHIVLSAKHFVSNGCQHCGETFESESALKIHARVHARKQRRPRSECRVPGDCTMCGETLQNETERRKHLLTAHPDSKAAQSAQADETPQCVCEICGKMFKKPCFLNYHMRVHTGEKPYTCNDCGKSYAYSGVLSEHKATHTSHPQHRCHLCPKTFKFKSALYKHVRAHLGIRPHKCHFCDKSFPTPCELRSHTHHTHHKVPWPKRERRRQRKSTQSTSREISYEYDN